MTWVYAPSAEARVARVSPAVFAVAVAADAELKVEKSRLEVKV